MLRSNSAAGVELRFRDNAAFTLNAAILKTGGEELEILETKIGIGDIGELGIESLVPVNLVLNGKGIVHKLVDASEDKDDRALLQEVLPNARLEDFYLDKVVAAGGKYMVSILRKDQVEPVLERFTKQGLYVVSVSLGPFVLLSVRTLLNGAAEGQWSVQMAGHRLEYESGELVSYQQENGVEAQVEIGGERMSDASVIPFAAAFEFLFNRSDERPTGLAAIRTAREELRQRKLFQVGGFAVLGIFLFALLANFLLFTSYSDTHEQLQGELFLSKDRIAYLSSLDQDVSARQGLLRQLGLLTPARTSFYADAIAASVPRAIRLTGILLNPLKKKVKVGENPLFEPGVIRVTGSSKKSTTLNDWVKLMKQMDWVGQVTVIDYQSTGRAGTGDFELNIEIE